MKLTLNKTKTLISKLKFTTGFTLVEMMVAIAVFSIVMVTAMSALLNIVDANNKARAIKTAVNNVNFALENISRDMRMGTDYRCLNDFRNIVSCTNSGHPGVAYKSPGSNVESGKFIYYKHEENNGGQIMKCIGDSDPTQTSCGGTWDPVTSSEVNIENLKFYVLKDLIGGKKAQPRMIITLSGKAGEKTKIQTSFNLQTSVSQRQRLD